MMSNITLFCLVHGEPTANAFSVEVEMSKTIDILKDGIKKKKPVDFATVDADKLNLWKVDIPVGDGSTIPQLVPKYIKMLPTSDIADFFTGNIPKKHIHVIVERPSDSDEIQRLKKENATLREKLGNDSSSLGKRKSEEILGQARKKALTALEGLPSPSEFASPSKSGSCLRNNEWWPLNHHRGAGHSDVPIQFYHEIFQTFLTRLDENQDDKDIEDIERYQELVRQLEPQISELNNNESNRAKIFLRFLYVLGLHLEPITNEQMRSDGTLYTSGPRRFLLCNLEVKSDFSCGQCAYMQNVGYYAKFVKDHYNENIDIEKRTSFPAFLILLEGTYLSICGAVFVDSICIDRLTTTIPLERVAYDHAMLMYTARALRALVTCIKDLDRLYTTLGSTTIPKTVSNNIFPRILDRIDLQYNRRLSTGKRLWLATMNDEGIKRMVVVKFTRHYATEVHRVCAEKGIAPILRYSQQLGYGWIMVIMDYLDGYHTLLDCRLTDSIQASIHARLKILHDAGFVHGDMRPPNILLGPGPDKDVKFIDFDWAGKSGSAKYPASMNPDLDWHPDVGLSKLIKSEHDRYYIDIVFDKSKELKRETLLCEWNAEYGLK